MFYILIRREGDASVTSNNLPGSKQYIQFSSVPCKCRAKDIESIQKEEVHKLGDDEFVTVGEETTPAASKEGGAASSSSDKDDEEEEEYFNFGEQDNSVCKFSLLKINNYFFFFSQ